MDDIEYEDAEDRGFHDAEDCLSRGMSLRDWFAGQAVVGILAGNDLSDLPPYDETHLAKAAFNLADAMLAARKEGGAA